MSELSEAAERVYSHAVYLQTEYTLEDHDDSDGLALINAQLVCSEYVKRLKDIRPLADLTDEQWESMGFTNDFGLLGTCHVLRVGNIRIERYKTSGNIYAGSGFIDGVTTLGQLRHLIAALS